MGGIVMTITKNATDSTLRIALEGRLDTNTAPQLEAELKASLPGVTELELDFSGLEYISSAGLRVLLSAQKTMNKQGKMTIHHVNETIMEVFEITGFVDILTIV
jgi:anti-anti-sigma factor